MTASRVRSTSSWPWLRVPRRTVRVRLTLLYGCLFLLAGAGLLAVTYVLVDQNTGPELFVSGKEGTIVVKGADGAAPHNTTPGLSDGNPTAQQLQLAGQLLSQAKAQRQRDLHQLLMQSGIALAIMTVVALLLGWLVAGRALRPLRDMTNTTRRITERNLHERLGLTGPRDEIVSLAETIDGLLARLEKAFAAQRHFVANASHELRTPLALDRTLIEVTLADADANTSTLRATLGELLASGEDQERLIDALLTLASSERGLDRREPIDLATVASAGIAVYGAAAAQRGVHIEGSLKPASISGSPRLIERLTFNLLDNAILYSHTGGRVEVTTQVAGGEPTLTVPNTGPVVPQEAIDGLFEPFQRLDGDRSRHPDGHGLGLSIVRAICVAHGTSLSARPGADGGLAVVVRFPCPPPSGPDAVARR